MSRLAVKILLFSLLLTSCSPETKRKVVIGSKKFTESVILADIAADAIVAKRDSSGSKGSSNSGAADSVIHRRELGGTTILWNALLAGDIDVYPEYTGTLTAEIFAAQNLMTGAALQAALEKSGVKMLAPLGFNNTYALGVKARTADSLGIKTISDLKKYPALRAGVSNEFLSRKDGWQGLKAHYTLPQTSVQGLDHDLAYRGIESGAIDIIDLYSTDAEIAYYHLRVLDDDLVYFPRYDAVLLVRANLEARSPEAVAALRQLSGKVSEAEMIKMNAAVKLEKKSERQVAASFLTQQLGIDVKRVDEASWLTRLGQNTIDHLALVILSLTASIAVSIPLGIWAAKSRRAGGVILGAVSVIQTVPSLALLVALIPLVGIGALPAMLALFLYSLLPVVRATATGITTLSPALSESADALGLEPFAKLWLVELPMASPQIISGIKTAAVINVGTATLGALVGAGGYGQPILTGIRLADTSLLLEGAVPAAALALVVQAVFGGLERIIVPKGLRLNRERS